MKDILIYVCQQLWKEMRNQPITLAVIVVLMGSSYYFYDAHASDEDFKEHVQDNVEVHAIFQGQMDLVIELQLADTINKLQERWCLADASGKQTLRPALNRYKSQYFQVTKRQFDSISCNEFIADNGV